MEDKRIFIINTDDKEKSYEIILFWGHKPVDKIEKNCMSQWYPSPFVYANNQYHNAEQFMMQQKARLFNDQNIMKEIMSTEDPALMKKLGRKIKGFNEAEWDKEKERIVRLGNFYKFIQNPLLKEYLLSTGNALLVEASPYDKVWGIGMSADEPDARYPEKWKGQNLLGKALMSVRALLRLNSVTKMYEKNERIPKA
jgi:ribA/ribD-fused uncharacterized protein